MESEDLLARSLVTLLRGGLVDRDWARRLEERVERLERDNLLLKEVNNRLAGALRISGEVEKSPSIRDYGAVDREDLERFTTPVVVDAVAPRRSSSQRKLHSKASGIFAFNPTTTELLGVLGSGDSGSTADLIQLWSVKEGCCLPNHQAATKFHAKNLKVERIKWLDDAFFWSQSGVYIEIWDKHQTAPKLDIELSAKVVNVDSFGYYLMMKYKNGYEIGKLQISPSEYKIAYTKITSDLKEDYEFAKFSGTGDIILVSHEIIAFREKFGEQRIFHNAAMLSQIKDIAVYDISHFCLFDGKVVYCFDHGTVEEFEVDQSTELKSHRELVAIASDTGSVLVYKFSKIAKMESERISYTDGKVVRNRVFGVEYYFVPIEDGATGEKRVKFFFSAKDS